MQTKWATGYVIQPLTITDTGTSTIIGWTVTFTLPAGHTLTGSDRADHAGGRRAPAGGGTGGDEPGGGRLGQAAGERRGDRRRSAVMGAAIAPTANRGITVRWRAVRRRGPR